MNDKLAHILRQCELYRISQNQLCKEAKLDKAQLSRWKNGPYSPHPRNLARLDAALSRLIYPTSASS